MPRRRSRDRTAPKTMTDSDSAKLDEILALVRKFQSLDSAVTVAMEESRLAKEQTDSERQYHLDREENGERAALMAWDLLQDAVRLMNKPNAKERSKWADKMSEFLHHCRDKHVWDDYNDPYYDPNATI